MWSGRKLNIPLRVLSAFMDLVVHATARMIPEGPTRQRLGLPSEDTPEWGHFPAGYE